MSKIQSYAWKTDSTGHTKVKPCAAEGCTYLTWQGNASGTWYHNFGPKDKASPLSGSPNNGAPPDFDDHVPKPIHHKSIFKKHYLLWFSMKPTPETPSMPAKVKLTCYVCGCPIKPNTYTDAQEGNPNKHIWYHDAPYQKDKKNTNQDHLAYPEPPAPKTTGPATKPAVSLAKLKKQRDALRKRIQEDITRLVKLAGGPDALSYYEATHAVLDKVLTQANQALNPTPPNQVIGLFETMLPTTQAELSAAPPSAHAEPAKKAAKSAISGEYFKDVYNALVKPNPYSKLIPEHKPLYATGINPKTGNPKKFSTSLGGIFKIVTIDTYQLTLPDGYAWSDPCNYQGIKLYGKTHKKIITAPKQKKTGMNFLLEGTDKPSAVVHNYAEPVNVYSNTSSGIITMYEGMMLSEENYTKYAVKAPDGYFFEYDSQTMLYCLKKKASNTLYLTSPVSPPAKTFEGHVLLKNYLDLFHYSPPEGYYFHPQLEKSMGNATYKLTKSPLKSPSASLLVGGAYNWVNPHWFFSGGEVLPISTITKHALVAPYGWKFVAHGEGHMKLVEDKP